MLKAIFFDMDGVIVDTERDGHRVAFNEAFKALGYQYHWSVDHYHRLLQIAGGKERIRKYLRDIPRFQPPEGRTMDELIKEMHLLKTEKFISLIEEGNLPLRPGIHRFMKEANDKGVIIGICTTSNERSAQAILQTLLGDIHIDFLLAGDVVSRKKPDPEVYNLALSKTGLAPCDCLVVEDSHNGLAAAKAAGLKVLVTVNGYTQNEDLNTAETIVSCLGDDAEKCKVLNGVENLLKCGLRYQHGMISLNIVK